MRYFKLHKYHLLVFIFLFLINGFKVYAQEEMRLIKSNYFVSHPQFPKYVKDNKLKQVTTQNGSLKRTTTYDANGKIIQDIYTSDYKEKTFDDDTYGKYSTSGFTTDAISPLSTQPSHLSLGNGDYYVGYIDVGTYYSKSGKVFTGFMLPTIKEFGNGSVLFMEDTEAKTCHWVLVVDGRIDWMFPANYSEMPDIEKLRQQFKMQFKIISELPRKRLGLKPKVNRVSNQFLEELLMCQITEINNQPNNGYGIHLVTGNSKMVADHIELFVGFFKNGQLNGMGYYANLENILFKSTYDKETHYVIPAQSVYASFGQFKQHQILQGREIKAERQTVDIDFWSATNYPGFTYSRYQKQGANLDAFPVVTLNELPNTIKVYIPSLDRTFNAKVDKEFGILQVASDHPKNQNKELYQNLDGKEETLYYVTNKPYSVSNSCPTTYQKAVYGTKNETSVAYYQFEHKRHVTKGGYYDREYNYTYQKPVYQTKSVSYLKGYETVICGVCNGTGKVTQSFSRTAYLPIRFEKVNTEGKFGFKSTVYRQNNYSKAAYMSLETKLAYEAVQTGDVKEMLSTIEMLELMATSNVTTENKEATKTSLHAYIVDELVFREEPEAATTFLKLFGAVRRTLILQQLKSEAAAYFKNYNWN